MSPDKGERKHFNVKDSRSGQIDRLQHRVQFIDPEFDFRRTDLQVRQTLKQQRRMHRQDATHQEKPLSRGAPRLAGSAPPWPDPRFAPTAPARRGVVGLADQGGGHGHVGAGDAADLYQVGFRHGHGLLQLAQQFRAGREHDIAQRPAAACAIEFVVDVLGHDGQGNTDANRCCEPMPSLCQCAGRKQGVPVSERQASTWLAGYTGVHGIRGMRALGALRYRLNCGLSPPPCALDIFDKSAPESLRILPRFSRRAHRYLPVPRVEWRLILAQRKIAAQPGLADRLGFGQPPLWHHHPRRNSLRQQ